ncbi:LytR C-terminal domain-containing protein [Cellulosimicrobium sp. Marseille-Q4280]|uniref:LytR C-terminal domain-containing protein n=1 Tax=Cellulosimicrobium sp. Marseille-Q4280 TaxID=2937992 RepID=UPI00203F1B35|nr:LytR C-terminal domain-containing protein [Cellulosimicrobium sp. Marseille-Q4280]
MTKSRYPYAPDEFDAPAPQGAPVGVHRSPRTRWSKTWPFLLVAVVFAGLAYGGFTLLSDGNGEAPPQAESTDPAGESTETPGDGETEAPAETEEPPAETEEPPVEETPAAPDIDGLMAVADPSALVRVMNDGGPTGSAGTGKDALDGRGFTNTTAEDFPGESGATGNVVWYTENRSDTAAAVAAILGIPAEQVTQETLRSGDVMVVITTELTPAG